MEPQNNQNRSIRNLALCLLLPLALIFIFFLIYSGGASSNETIPYSEIYAYFKEDKVEKCELNLGTGRTVLLLREQYRTDTDKNGKIDEKDVIVYKVPDVSMFYNDIQDIILENGVEYVPVEANNTWAIISSLLPVVLMVILLVFGWGMMRRSINSMGGGAMNFGRARVKLQSDDKRKTTFADVAGADEEKAELQEIVEFLKISEKIQGAGRARAEGRAARRPSGHR